MGYHAGMSTSAPARTRSPHLLILGGGFTGHAVARLGRSAGATVTATTRKADRADGLRAQGIDALLAPALEADAIATRVDEDTRVLVTFPPDGATDRRVAPALARAAAIAYVSSTGVYGEARGHIDDGTPANGASPRAKARLDAETIWRDRGAVIVRAPGIYGPGRGMHLRLARGELRIPGDGTKFLSRTHVADLAAALWALLVLPAPRRGETFVMGDAEPAPHIQVVRWLCDAMELPLPPFAPLDEVDETLRNDRRVDSARLRALLPAPLAYPTYREGFAQCLAADAEVIARARRGPSAPSPTASGK